VVDQLSTGRVPRLHDKTADHHASPITRCASALDARLESSRDNHKPALTGADEVFGRHKDEQQMLALLNESLDDREGGRFEDALRKMRHIRETYPYDVAAALVEGTAEAAMGNFEAAVEPLLRCLILSPRQKVTWRTAAEVLESLGARGEALFCRAAERSL
jgi:predicted Zn-dependent protease